MARRRTTVFREEARTLTIGDRAAARVAIVSDTHARPHPALLEHVAAERPAAILHAGDIGDLTLLDRLGAIAPVAAVRGNVDGRGEGLADGLVVTLRDGEGPFLVAYLTHVGVRATRLYGDIHDRARAAGAGLVVCGHSHVPLLVRNDGLIVFNPGSCGPRRFRLPITFGVLDLGPAGARLRHVDCETGAPWTPAAGG